jgi:hypothetical protein
MESRVLNSENIPLEGGKENKIEPRMLTVDIIAIIKFITWLH